MTCMLRTQGPGNLLPLGIVRFGMITVLSILIAKVGAFVAKNGGTSA